MDALRRVIESMQRAAQEAGVRLVTGDTKVVEHGKGDGLYVNTSGVGLVRTSSPVGPQRVQPGDVVILSADIGRHGVAIMAVREGLGFETTIASDCASLAAPVLQLIEAGVVLHCMRDLTRGGLATGLIEIAQTSNTAILLDEAAIPVSDPVRGACEILGLDPLYVANEGRFVALVPAADAARAAAILRQFNDQATVIGRVEAAAEFGSVRASSIGGARVLDLLSGEQLPRIC